jgi:hypothetical protein
LIPINLDEETQAYAKTFCYKIGKFPFVYLGVPLHYERDLEERISNLGVTLHYEKKLRLER